MTPSMATPPFSLVGLDHVVLCVADVARAAAFYEAVLGAAVERRIAALGLVQMRAGGSLIDLLPVEGTPTARNMDHFCLRIEPWEEAALRAHLAAHGVEAGEAGTRYGAEGFGPSIYIQDPDGNTVELKGPPEKP